MDRELIVLLVKSAYLEGIEAGVNEVPAAPEWRSEQGTPPEDLWQASRAKKLVEKWCP